jgi:hypothetical protein
MKDKFVLDAILDKLACHYSLSGNVEFDKGYNQAVKDLCTTFIEEAKKEHNTQWYTERLADILNKSF